MKFYLLLFINLSVAVSLNAQNSLAEKLGYSAEDKLLIIHADDLGVSHAQNSGSFEAITNGVVNSGSIMMPCPWVSEVAAFYQQNPNLDFGLHLTLSNEWDHLRWGTVASSDQVSSILNEQGYMYPDCLEFSKHALLEDVEIELRAQIELAYDMGLKPTHLDAHMGCLVFTSAEVFEIYLKLGREYKIPCMLGRFFLKAAPQNFLDKITEQDIVLERTFTAGPQGFDNGLDTYYQDLLKNKIMPGVQILLIHPARDNEELRAMASSQIYWGAEWREQDLDFFTSEKCKQILQDENIKLITWGEIQKLYYNH